MTGPFLVYTVLLLLGSVKAGISSYGIPLGAISCVKCLDDGCPNATKVWRSQNGTDDNVWPKNGSGNSIPVCRFYSTPPETWYHVCKKNSTVFMVTNDTQAGVSFALEASGKDLKSERKTGNECPTLEPEPPTTGNWGQITVTQSPSVVVSRLNHNATLACRFSHTPDQGVTGVILYWYRPGPNGKDLYIYPDSQAQPEYKNRVVALDRNRASEDKSVVLQNATWTDSQRYRCMLSYETPREPQRKRGGGVLLLLHDSMTFDLAPGMVSELLCSVEVSPDPGFRLSVFQDGVHVQTAQIHTPAPYVTLSLLVPVAHNMECRLNHSSGFILSKTYSIQPISCVKCSDDGCPNATKGWRSQSGKDYIVWDRNGLGNAIPVCKFFSPPSGTWFHVCKKNSTVFMVTNDTQAGVSFTLEASGKDLKSERKTGNECPTLEPEPPTTGPALECCSVGRDGTPCATVPCSHAPGLPRLSPVCLTCLMIILISSSCY